MEPMRPLTDECEHEHARSNDNDSAAVTRAVDGASSADAVPATAATDDAHNDSSIGSSNKVVHELSLRGDHLRSLVGLDLPFYTSHVERVLETIGGLASLQQAHANKSQFLSVKLRPTEPSCKPLFADLAKTQTILLRVKRKRNATGDTPTSSIDAKIVGLVRDAYVCEGMADFQYFTSRTFYPDAGAEATATARELALDPNAAVVSGSATQRALKASLRPYLRVDHISQLEMIPEVFSKVDLPLKYEFRQRSGYQPSEPAKKVTKTMTYLNFHDDVAAPAEPTPENPIVRRRPIGVHDAVDDHVLRILQTKLALKPVWLRPALFTGLDVLERRAARRLLRKLCYVFVDGPWRGSWIRMGYDPRLTPDASRYQVIELRNNRELVHAKVTLPTRKRTKKYSGVNPKGPRIVKVTQTTDNESAQASKRRRKERFLLSDTRRAYLADATATAPFSTSEQLSTVSEQQLPTDSAGPDVNDGSANEYDSDMELIDDANDAASVASSAASSSALPPRSTAAGARTSERLFEIFGVPLASANVLFQLDEIDDDEVRAWVAQFPLLTKPTLLGGWLVPHVFAPLRDVVRYRIAALVGRSKADLDARRKRIDALKKQALADYAEQQQLAASATSVSTTTTATTGSDARAMTAVDATAGVADADDLMQTAFEESLARDHAVASRSPNAPATARVSVDSDHSGRVNEPDNDNNDEGDDDVEMDDDDDDDDDDDGDDDDDASDNDATEQASSVEVPATLSNALGAAASSASTSAAAQDAIGDDAAAAAPPIRVDSAVNDVAMEYSF